MLRELSYYCLQCYLPVLICFIDVIYLALKCLKIDIEYDMNGVNLSYYKNLLYAR